MKKLDTKEFALVCGEAISAPDRDQFVSDWSLSSIWGDNPEDDISTDRIEMLAKIWDVSHMSIKEIRSIAGVSQRKFGEAFLIPTRTVENWESGKSTASIYDKLMLADLVGIIDLDSIREIR